MASGIEEIIFVTGKGKSALEDHFDRSYYLENMLRERNKDLLLTIVESVVPTTGTIVHTLKTSRWGLGMPYGAPGILLGTSPLPYFLPMMLFSRMFLSRLR
ncbi:MAG: hypothetical protein P4L42_03120 [Desulfocapsaceae bacterium]|nr:hypothetical protein [Desulfocapsaceae bacterium]